MRGKPRTDQQERHCRRIIPAHAGQTLLPVRRPRRQPDHPRACGANSLVTCVFCWTNGSSPRMRGKQGGRRKLERELRIIPAHAGQTRLLARPHGARPDHPRACGANVEVSRLVNVTSGSSPRMRGKLIRNLDGDHRVRIIPAHAGQTLRCCCRRCDIPDHPRACGANSASRRNRPRNSGSSPRMRGKHPTRMGV